MIQLSENQLKLITEEAEKYFSVPGGYGRIVGVDGYIAAATLYQEKIKLERERVEVLVANIQEHIAQWDGEPKRAMRLVEKELDVFTNYNKALKP